jgi:cephalosporin hydroxylase
MSARRSLGFRERKHGRYWWHQAPSTGSYVPPIYAVLSEEEWQLVEEWYEETEAEQHIGEIGVPAMSFIQGLVLGSGIRRVVQLGHYYGYSTMLLGFMLRSVGFGTQLVSIDIDREATRYTQRWVDRAGLNEWVTLYCGNSADAAIAESALKSLGGEPRLILIDSSHQYAHTLAELDLWVPKMPIGALMLLHDTSVFAQAWDATEQGGVKRALEEWVVGHPEVTVANLNCFAPAGVPYEALSYRDGCGLAIVQKIA